jgi:hypothetical protein
VLRRSPTRRFRGGHAHQCRRLQKMRCSFKAHCFELFSPVVHGWALIALGEAGNIDFRGPEHHADYQITAIEEIR